MSKMASQDMWQQLYCSGRRFLALEDGGSWGVDMVNLRGWVQVASSYLLTIVEWVDLIVNLQAILTEPQNWVPNNT
jgi:hypothetical protein